MVKSIKTLPAFTNLCVVKSYMVTKSANVGVWNIPVVLRKTFYKIYIVSLTIDLTSVPTHDRPTVHGYGVDLRVVNEGE